MPEYLHPGVYIEETSFRGKSIEGVSTSTAGLVGRTTRGPEGTPTLVTSFAKFKRDFGDPYPITAGVAPGPGDYLGHAVRAFFENGGRRAYIVRTLHSDADWARSPAPSATAFPAAGWETSLGRGTVASLPASRVLRASFVPPAPAVAARIPVTSLRGIRANGGAQINIFTRPSALDPFTRRGPFNVTDVDGARNEIVLGGGLTPAQLGLAVDTGSYASGDVYLTIEGAAPTKVAAGLPVFRARSRGSDGNAYAVQVRSSDRPAIAISGDNAAHDRLDVASVANVYRGAVVEIDLGAPNHVKAQALVTDVNATTRQILIDTALAASPPAGSTLRVLEMDVLVYDARGLAETFAGLTWNPNPATASFTRFYRERINDPQTGSKLVTVLALPAEPAATLASQPVTLSGQPVLLVNGTDGSALDDIDLIGSDGGPGNRTGIEALRERDDIALVAVPGVTMESVQAALLVHCEQLRYRFAVLDGIHSSDVSAIQAHRNNHDSKYGGYYTPWLLTMDLATGREMLAPPAGYVLGICARVDNERGVHKAPANEVVRGITGIGLPFGDGEQDVLNPIGVNLIREFEGRGIRVWGGRTTTSDTEWKYVNVRRLFIYLEHSIDRGTQWVVFEPNNESLWQRVVETIDSFLFGVWKSGALMGTKPEDAYFVRCDRTTMTQDDIDNGRLVCEIGVAPAYPAEFVIFRIGQFTASSNA
jgi:phage tail sheath protein FI